MRGQSDATRNVVAVGSRWLTPKSRWWTTVVLVNWLCAGLASLAATALIQACQARALPSGASSLAISTFSAARRFTPSGVVTIC
jgi:hypothetical protein